MPSAYTVQLEKFQGPLDVLLQLIEEQKLPITEVALATVTQQFLEHLRSLTDVNPDLLADFLTVASKLLVIKSKSLLPSIEEELEDEDATDLTAQLFVYKQFKEIARYLKTLEARNRTLYFREGPIEHPVSFFPDPNVSTRRLELAMQSLAKSLEEITALPKSVVKEVVSIAEKIRELQTFLAQKLEMRLSESIANKSRTEVIVTFLAMLELIKQRILSVEQESLFADITIRQEDGARSANLNTG